jgi:hypothetical protein
MKNTDSIISTYRLARYALAAGTFLTAWITWRNFAEGYFGAGIVSALLTILLSVVTLLVFDGVAFSSLESAVKHIFKQEAMPTRSAWGFALLIGFAAYAGSMIFSLRAVPVLADASVEDKSETYKDMQATKIQGDANRAALLREANAEITRAESALKAAQAKAKTSNTDGVKAQGGEFARLYLSGNSWVRTAPAFKRQRAAVARHEATAAQAVQEATNTLKRAQEAKTALLTGKDVETAQIIAAQSAAVETWQNRLGNSKAIIFYLTLFSGALSILLLLNLGSLRAVPDSKDLIDVLRESFDLGMDALVFAFGGVNDWARSKARLGVVAGPMNASATPVQVQSVAPNIPSATAQQSATQRAQRRPKFRRNATRQAHVSTSLEPEVIRGAIRAQRSKLRAYRHKMLNGIGNGATVQAGIEKAQREINRLEGMLRNEKP